MTSPSGESRPLDGERASVLALLPAAVLVFLVLGALAFDVAVAFQGERQVANLAAAAANDAATRGLDLDRFYADGSIVLDPSNVEQIVGDAVEIQRLGDDALEDVDVVVALGAEGASVTVTVSARVPYVFSKALPGGPDSVTVSASSTFDAVAPGLPDPP